MKEYVPVPDPPDIDVFMAVLARALAEPDHEMVVPNGRIRRAVWRIKGRLIR